jgi:hypothetical protein
MDLIHLAIKVSKPKATLAYRFLVAAPATKTNQSNLCYDKEYTQIRRCPMWSGPMHIHSLLSPPPYCHYARIFITE